MKHQKHPSHPRTLPADDAWELRWVEAFAAHASQRFESRALVRAAVGGEKPVPLAYIHALPGAGLVLVLAEDPAPLGRLGPPGHHGHHDTATPGGEDPAAVAERELWAGSRQAGTREIWISSPDQAVFHVDRPKEGALSTGFGRLGISRTPDLLLPRTAATPEPKDHQHHF